MALFFFLLSFTRNLWENNGFPFPLNDWDSFPFREGRPPLPPHHRGNGRCFPSLFSPGGPPPPGTAPVFKKLANDLPFPPFIASPSWGEGKKFSLIPSLISFSPFCESPGTPSFSSMVKEVLFREPLPTLSYGQNVVTVPLPVSSPFANFDRRGKEVSSLVLDSSPLFSQP